MPNFVVRVEMHSASAEHYEMLHEKMKARGYKREAQGTDGRMYRLPDAEYMATKSFSADDVRDETRAMADSIVPGSFVLVSQVEQVSWFLAPAS
ncbi:hypothetical protein [Halomonas elongata]|uniref:DUF2622 domain-containing protein n=1 Tax=Halomonas elongata (strain ATCC 33173 / DSM 2581 / NBRC 15536 / NCIMB 2198 / 1H9) TaxID=768066 RepID=A0A1R4A4C9_HALED|nr:hypothetical protein [Halomonas elongata]WBF19245.1 hypothetical protein LM502_06020 [Halomonas elongata]WPU48105.1 hypothetical protein SR933_04245 [Halomonas elongata DSM 2581]SJK83762.1 uncharacterized protein HELO_2105C [Halomonas elongata DSM 2581]